MVNCQNCGNTNTTESNFCRFCGTKFLTQQQPPQQQGYDFSPPRPYVWKTDEFQTQNEPRKAATADRVQPIPDQFHMPHQNYQPQPLAYRPMNQMGNPYLCPQCMNRYPPRVERRISTAGWIVFAVLLVVFFPLFWIGLLMKEDVLVCQVCNARIA